MEEEGSCAVRASASLSRMKGGEQQEVSLERNWNLLRPPLFPTNAPIPFEILLPLRGADGEGWRTRAVGTYFPPPPVGRSLQLRDKRTIFHLTRRKRNHLGFVRRQSVFSYFRRRRRTGFRRSQKRLCEKYFFKSPAQVLFVFGSQLLKEALLYFSIVRGYVFARRDPGGEPAKEGTATDGERRGHKESLFGPIKQRK